MKLPHEILGVTRPIIGTDLETTRRDPKRARIVELALEIMAPDKPTKEYRTLVNPGEPIPAESTAIHGITDEMVANAPNFGALADNLLRGFSNSDFIAYSGDFDLRVLSYEFKRVKINYEFEDARVLDPLRLWQHLEPRSLEDAVEHWLRPLADADAEISELIAQKKAHSALWDTKATVRVLAAMLMARPQLGVDLDALHKVWVGDRFDLHRVLRTGPDGRLIMNLGQHKDEPLDRIDRGYLKWMLRSDFPDKVKDACRHSLAKP